MSSWLPLRRSRSSTRPGTCPSATRNTRSIPISYEGLPSIGPTRSGVLTSPSSGRARGGLSSCCPGLEYSSCSDLRLSNTCGRFFCLEAEEEVLRVYGTPEIFYTDQGATFKSPDFTKVFLGARAKLSKDGKGRALDNIERFWRTLLYDDVYLKDYTTMLETKDSLGKFIRKYNTQRPHAAYDGQPPMTTYTSNFEIKVPALASIERAIFMC
jgi:hypothetical protein